MGLFSSLFKSGDPVRLEDQRTPGQIQSADFLTKLGTTGTAGGLNLGEAFTGSLGDFRTTEAEKVGLAQLLSPTGPGKEAQSVFSRLAQAGPSSDLIDSFRKEAGRARLEGSDLLNREAAITGNRFGTSIIGKKADLEENIQDDFQRNLAQLLIGQQGVNLQAAQGLAGSGQTELQNLFNFGGIERNLKNQEAQAKFNEFNRQRAEELGRVDIAGSAARLNPHLGISELPGSPSPFSSLIGSVLGAAGTAAGAAIGGPAGAAIGGSLVSSLGGLFGGDRTTSRETNPVQGPLQRGGSF